MEDINKSVQSTPSSDDLFCMIVAPEIRILLEENKFEINNLLFKYQDEDDAAAVP